MSSADWRKEVKKLSDEELFTELQKPNYEWQKDVIAEILCRIFGRLISKGDEE